MKFAGAIEKRKCHKEIDCCHCTLHVYSDWRWRVASVIVLDDQPPTFLTRHANQTVAYGDDAAFEVSYDGLPSPNVTWWVAYVCAYFQR